MFETNNIQVTPEIAEKYAQFQEEAIPHMDALHNYALRMTANPDDADDLIQETYLKAFHYFDKYKKGTNCKAWLFRILKNSYINNYRKLSKEPDKLEYDSVQNFYEYVKSNEVDYQHLAEDTYSSVLDDDIASAISNLPVDFQTVIILSDIEGYNYDEIAEFVDCPVGTVRSRLHRARKMLYVELYNYAVDKGLIEEEAHNESY